MYLLLSSSNKNGDVLAINKWRTQRSLLQDSVGHGGSTNLSAKAVPPPQMNRIPLIAAKKSSLNTTTLAPRTPSNPKVNEAETDWSDGQQQFSTGTPRKIDGIISSVEAMEIDVVGEYIFDYESNTYGMVLYKDKTLIC